MILNTGNRTDIPAFYSQWFMIRIHEGYVLSRNPYNEDLVLRYQLSPDVVDLIQFCTKNPTPLLPYIDGLKRSYRMYFMVTITPYGTEIEPHVSNKNRIIDATKSLSKKLGKENVIWRYDPIFINDKYTLHFHIHIFEEMCKKLSGYVDACIFSYIDLYKKTEKNFPEVREVTREEKEVLAQSFSAIASRYAIKLRTCLENDAFLNKYNIDTSGCATKDKLEAATNLHFNIPKSDMMARTGCQCLLGNDIGAYNTCFHECRYCYANYDNKLVEKNMKLHDPSSPLLIGHVKPTDIIRDAKQISYIDHQTTIFDFQ